MNAEKGELSVTQDILWFVIQCSIFESNCIIQIPVLLIIKREHRAPLAVPSSHTFLLSFLEASRDRAHWYQSESLESVYLLFSHFALLPRCPPKETSEQDSSICSDSSNLLEVDKCHLVVILPVLFFLSFRSTVIPQIEF